MASTPRPAQSFFEVPRDRRSPRRVKESAALRLYREVLQLDHLHYGLWEGEELSLENLRAAQDRYLEHLLAEIPQGVRSVLDVGSGIGTTSRELLRRGYDVEGLSPDPSEARHYLDRVDRPFHLGRFQEFVSSRAFDLVLMSESAQYIWLDDLFEAVRRTVDDGWLLVCDYFVVAPATAVVERSGHHLDDFLARAQRAGWKLDLEKDITEGVLPTLDLGRRWLEQLIVPSLRIGRDTFHDRRPWLYLFGNSLFGRRLANHLEKLQLQVSSAEFRRTKRYMILRFRLPGAAVADVADTDGRRHG